MAFRSYLLALDNGASCFTSNQVAAQIGQDPIKFSIKYDNGNSLNIVLRGQFKFEFYRRNFLQKTSSSTRSTILFSIK